MMFSEEEIEALVLGSRWVTKRGDKRLAAAAADALAKIGSVLPAELKEKLDGSTLLVGPRQPVADRIDLGVLRKAIRSEHKLELSYLDNDGRDSRRTVWPFALGFFEETRVLAAWCELRQDFRYFRTDRIAEAAILASRYPRRRQALLKDWRAARGVDPVGV